MEKIFIFSDSHFGSKLGKFDEKRRISLFFDFIERVEKEATQLFLLGDIFDFWFEYRRCVPSDYPQVISALCWMARKIPVNYIAGNHDLWIGRYFEEMGIEVHRNSFELEIQGKKFLFAHGDMLMKTDLGGRMIRLLMGNSVSTFLYSLLHPDLGIALAKWVSKLSRMNSTKEKPRELLPSVVEKCLRRGEYFGVVMGHYHFPYLERVGEGVFMIVGDWIEHFTYGVLTENDIAIHSILEGKIREIEFS